VLKGVIDYSNHWFLSKGKSKRNADIRESVDEIDSSELIAQQQIFSQ
jgi:hypothetical protein